ncbi:probable carbohydrate esterase At4g34215 [Cucurbita pepo subsp. pepo]|uniref:probable carbohydrate esterase At4g34215 n=1 Tax=Cucurbita pepo subsp. pepo TaxID=3664 RepID=UPI000C9D8983|nr:probable carbohydrate esterase At4g34215 [Cucurbita pepo subsp. pepo]
MLYFSLLFLMAAHLPPTSQQPPPPTAIFLLAGQSNMAGRGGVTNSTLTHRPTWDGVVPPQCSPNPSILRLASDLTWVEAREPLHADIDFLKTNGIGPGMPFANTILMDKPAGRTVIGLVPCAMGGSSIQQWQKGSNLYTHLLTRAEASILSGGTIKALLWYQGESDTVNAEDSELYGGRLKKFFSDIRSDLHIPFLPIIQVGIASGEGPYKEGVRRGQFGIEVMNVMTVDAYALGLSFEPDGLHLNTHSQVKLGGVLADAYRRFPPHPLAASPLLRSAASTASVFSFFISMFSTMTFVLLQQILLS